MCRVDFSYDETGIIPGGDRESGEEAKDDHHILLRVNHIEEKHRGGGQEDSESCMHVVRKCIVIKIML